jgi:hypothetical protein
MTKTDPHKPKPSVIAVLSRRVRHTVFIVSLKRKGKKASAGSVGQ